MELKYHGDEVLRENCKEVPEDFDVQNTASEMAKIMQRHAGAGIAAPQVGLPLRMFIAKLYQGEPKVFVNPVINSYSKETVPSIEGCLSIPAVLESVPRSLSVDVTYYNQFFEKIRETFTGYHAIVIQHEYDHLNGVLFIDHLPKEKQEVIQMKLKEIR